jgi:diguanylate cyclase (GGDEF)-like protein
MESRCIHPGPELQPGSGSPRFWHCVQLYERETFLAETVAAYAARGLNAGDAVVIVAKDRNRSLFEFHLAAEGVDLAEARRTGQLTLLSAEQTLAEFMQAGWPDADRFRKSVGELVRKLASRPWKGIRAFGEMVAVLWDLGQPAAALRLEELWDELAETENFSLLCAYAMNSFDGASGAQSFLGVCDSHSLVRPSESYLGLKSDEERLRFVARLQQQALPKRSGPPLPDPDLAREVLSRAFRNSSGTALLAVLEISLDDWACTSSRTGPSAADGVLIEIIERLKLESDHSATGRQTVIRTASDEFTIVMEQVSGYASVDAAAQRIQKSLTMPYKSCGCELTLSACIGVGFSPAVATDAAELRRNADTALWHAKRQGKGRIEFYSARLGKSAHLYRHLESNLRGALGRNELQVYFQPEISLHTSQPIRFEALLRWFPAPGCSVPPTTFIPVAEESGLILTIGEWVLRQACQQAAEWQQGELAGTGVAVNVSSIQFAEPGFVGLVAECLAESGLLPSLLELELTETVLIREFEQSQKTLTQLKRMGVTIAIDDFGTGYSSLSYLQRLSIDALKIDRCFIADLAESWSKAPVLRGLIGIAHELGIRVIAEGVETPEQLEAVIGYGCDEVQGFLMGHPEPRRQEDFALSS